MSFSALFQRHDERLTRRLERMVGSRETAEELRQETFLRAWRHAPRGLSPEQEAAWLHRTASNLALDELRRRGRRRGALEDAIPLDGNGHAAGEVPAADGDAAEALAVREALGRLSPHERMVLLLRFEAGLSYGEIGQLLDVSAEAARKRADRAREALARHWGELRPARPPLILLVAREDQGPYRSWLERAGARVRPLRRAPAEREVALADGLVVGGSVTDVDPALYGEEPRARIVEPDLERDLSDVSLLRAALRQGVPIVGVCRGHQLLNVALGGSLFQDLEQDGVARLEHWRTVHRIDTAPGTRLRSLLGRRPSVTSEHHQANRRLGRGLRPTATSPDGVVESVELSSSAFALGLQWHPEYPESGSTGRLVAESLVEAAARRAA